MKWLGTGILITLMLSSQALAEELKPYERRVFFPQTNRISNFNTYYDNYNRWKEYNRLKEKGIISRMPVATIPPPEKFVPVQERARLRKEANRKKLEDYLQKKRQGKIRTISEKDAVGRANWERDQQDHTNTEPSYSAEREIQRIEEQHQEMLEEIRRNEAWEEQKLEEEREFALEQYKKEKRRQIFFEAIHKDDTETLLELIREGMDLKETYKGYTPLHYAASLRNRAVIMELLQHGADIGTPESNYYSLLHWGAYNNDKELIEALLDKRALADVKDANNLTPLDYAVANDSKDVVPLLRGHLEGSEKRSRYQR